MFYRILLLTLVLAQGLWVHAQQSFHRNYATMMEDDMISLAAVQMKDGNYVALDLIFNRNDLQEKTDSLVITSYKPKGDVNWSRKIILPDSLQGAVYSDVQIFQAENDSIYCSIKTKKLVSGPNTLIICVTNGGTIAWVKGFGVNNRTANQSGNYLQHFRNTFINAYITDTLTSNTISFSRNQYDGTPLFGRNIVRSNVLNPNQFISLTHFHVASDSTLLFTGDIDTDRGSYFLVADSAGTIKTSGILKAGQADLVIESAVKLQDTSMVFSGKYITNSQNFVFLARTDKNGKLLWSKTIQFADGGNTFPAGLTLTKDNQIVAAGIHKDYYFLIRLKNDGSVVWQKKYPGVKVPELYTQNADSYQSTSPFEARDGGTGFITTGLVDGKMIPTFIKVNTNGETTCEENVDEPVIMDTPFSTDTLLWDVGNVIFNQKKISHKAKAFDYDEPVVTLEVRPFCPDEPIDWTFNVPVEGAVDYEWSTGTNRGVDSLRVFEEGEYSVTVTIGKGVCFMLCDTSEIARYDEPQARLVLSLGRFCQNDKQTIFADYVPGHPQIKSIVWSTGESGVGNIEIATPGTYKVTITDQCDEIATEEINVGAFPKKITKAGITADVSIDCFGGTATGILTAGGDSNGLGLERFLWSTGEKSKSISINSTSTLNYAVTVIDGCGGTATANYTIELKGTGLKNVNIVPNKARLCFDKVIELNAVTDIAGKYTYKWSNGSTEPKIAVEAPGTYSVTVIDACGNPANNSRDLKADDFIIEKLISDLRLNSYTRSDCSGIDVGISFSPDNNFSLLKTYKWSSGETTPGIAFTGGKVYSVTITDICDTEYTVSAQLDAPDISYAHVFFPDGTGYRFEGGDTRDTLAYDALILNRTYGPINKKEYCLQGITDYEFYIFNRWGQKVFESTDWTEEWNGKIGDQDAQGDTYVWVVRYKIFGFEKKLKGDVTMIRL
jgi:hypothetical protein